MGVGRWAAGPSAGGLPAPLAPTLPFVPGRQRASEARRVPSPIVAVVVPARVCYRDACRPAHRRERPDDRRCRARRRRCLGQGGGRGCGRLAARASCVGRPLGALRVLSARRPASQGPEVSVARGHLVPGCQLLRCRDGRAPRSPRIGSRARRARRDLGRRDQRLVPRSGTKPRAGTVPRQDLAAASHPRCRCDSPGAQLVHLALESDHPCSRGVCPHDRHLGCREIDQNAVTLLVVATDLLTGAERTGWRRPSGAQALRVRDTSPGLGRPNDGEDPGHEGRQVGFGFQ